MEVNDFADFCKRPAVSCECQRRRVQRPRPITAFAQYRESVFAKPFLQNSRLPNSANANWVSDVAKSVFDISKKTMQRIHAQTQFSTTTFLTFPPTGGRCRTILSIHREIARACAGYYQAEKVIAFAIFTKVVNFLLFEAKYHANTMHAKLCCVT